MIRELILLLYTAKHGLVFCDECMNSYRGNFFAKTLRSRSKESAVISRTLCVCGFFFLRDRDEKKLVSWDAACFNVMLRRKCLQSRSPCSYYMKRKTRIEENTMCLRFVQTSNRLSGYTPGMFMEISFERLNHT